jgi:hypothetical protein
MEVAKVSATCRIGSSKATGFAALLTPAFFTDFPTGFLADVFTTLFTTLFTGFLTAFLTDFVARPIVFVGMAHSSTLGAMTVGAANW